MCLTPPISLRLQAYAINVWLFIVLFFLIDKQDEYQLVNFILKFKGFQAVSALITATLAASKMCRHPSPHSRHAESCSHALFAF